MAWRLLHGEACFDDEGGTSFSNEKRRRQSTEEAVERRKKRACSGDEEDLDRAGRFCGRESVYSRAFGFLFPNRSYPMDASNCLQLDTTHWILDMSVFIGEEYSEVKEICIYLAKEIVSVFPPEKALAVYAQSPGSQFQYCGAVHVRSPSAVLSLLWPAAGRGRHLMPPNSAPLSAKIGICVEDLRCLPNLDMGKQKQVEDLAVKVGQNLLNFMRSFCSVEVNKLVVPVDILDRWFKRFGEKSRKDPAYL